MQSRYLTDKPRSRAAKTPRGVSARRKPDRKPAIPQHRNRERRDSPRRRCAPA